MLALVAGAIAHSNTERSEREKLALSLSSGQNLTGIDLHDKNLAGDFIGGKTLDEANLRGADLRHAVLRHSRLIHADLSAAKLQDADLRFADLRRADLRSTHLENANLTEAKLEDAQLAGAHLRGAILDGAKARGADFRDADLRDAQLLGTDLREAFLEADARGAVFSADYRDAKLDGAAVQRLRLDDTTVFPPDFDLKQRIAELSARPPKPVPIRKGAIADTVVDVADGDTIALEHGPKVRLLGINAPRVERTRECYALAAKADVASLLRDGTRVLYKIGPTKEDDFGRTLAYVWTRDGRFVNEAIVERGDALFKPPPRKKREERDQFETFYVRRLRSAEIRAEMAQRGLWKACTSLPSAEAGR